MPLAGTYTRYDAQGLREDLTDVIYNISPEDTPFTSSIARGPADQTIFEWQTDALADVNVDNAVNEGADTTFTTPEPTVRVGNYTQISEKEVIISRTLEQVSKAGRRSELAYQMQKKGAELRRDMEAIHLNNQAGDPGNIGAPRRLAGLSAWLKTNTNFGAGGLDPTYTAGVPLGDPTFTPGAGREDGTQRPFIEADFQEVVQEVWTEGGNPRVLMVGPYNKTVVSSTFEGIATRNFDLSNVSPRPTAVIASVDVYVSDFGTLRVIPNRFQRERDAWILDFEMFSTRFLSPIRTYQLAKTGDADKRLMNVEYTLQVRQEAGAGIVADLTETA